MENGMVSLRSQHSVDATIARLHQMVEGKPVKIFALIDHSGEAEQAGLKMPNTKVLILGNPKAGTPLMLAAPPIAIDLPLKILVREDAEGEVWISYHSPEFLRDRHELPAEFTPVLAAVASLAENAAK